MDASDAVPTPQEGLSLTLTLPPGQRVTAGEHLGFLATPQPLPFTVPDASHLQIIFNLDVGAVLSFATTSAQSCQLPGDLDCDCDVDLADIMHVANCWRRSDPECASHDLDGDGSVNVVDVMQVAVRQGEDCSTRR